MMSVGVSICKCYRKVRKHRSSSNNWNTLISSNMTSMSVGVYTIKKDTNLRPRPIPVRNDIEINSVTSHRSVLIQTDYEKTYNILNSLGDGFKFRHTFDSKHLTLQLPDSSVTLTVSEADALSGNVECYAATFSHLPSVYEKLKNVLEPNEEICTAAIEYVFPSGNSLQEFACVDMQVGKAGKNFRAWKIESDGGKGPVVGRHQIPEKESVSSEDENIDCWYETRKDGKVRIYLKTFSWLVCTVCNDKEYGLGLTGKIYAKPETSSASQLHVTMYILDDIMLLPDYAQSIDDDGKYLKLTRPIRIPQYVKLEDKISVRLILIEDTCEQWERMINFEEEMEIDIHSLTTCHKERRRRPAYTIDWYFKRKPGVTTVGSFVFQCLITASFIPEFPGVSHQTQDTKFLVTYEDDLSIFKKRQSRSYEHTLPDRGSLSNETINSSKEEQDEAKEDLRNQAECLGKVHAEDETNMPAGSAISVPKPVRHDVMFNPEENAEEEIKFGVQPNCEDARSEIAVGTQRTAWRGSGAEHIPSAVTRNNATMDEHNGSETQNCDYEQLGARPKVRK